MPTTLHDIRSCIGIQNAGIDPFYRDFNLLEQEDRCLETIQKALELGLNFFDASKEDPSPSSPSKDHSRKNIPKSNLENRDSTTEALLSKAIRQYGRNKFIITKKFSLNSLDVNPKEYKENPNYTYQSNSTHSAHSPNSYHSNNSPYSNHSLHDPSFGESSTGVYSSYAPHSTYSPPSHSDTHSPFHSPSHSPLHSPTHSPSQSYSSHSPPRSPMYSPHSSQIDSHSNHDSLTRHSNSNNSNSSYSSRYPANNHIEEMREGRNENKRDEENDDYTTPRPYSVSILRDHNSPPKGFLSTSSPLRPLRNPDKSTPQIPASGSRSPPRDISSGIGSRSGMVSLGSPKRFSSKKDYIRRYVGISESIEEIIRSQLDDTLIKLGADYIDLYYLQESDIDVDVIEEIMNCLKLLIIERKILYIGISCTNCDVIRRAHYITPITAIFIDYSLQSRQIENEIIHTIRELGIGIIAKNPLGTGFLSGTFLALDELPLSDWRGRDKRFSPEYYSKTAHKKFVNSAEKHGCTPNQLALVWLRSRGNDIFPLICTRSAEKVNELFQALKIELNREDIDDIGNIIDFETNSQFQTVCASTFSRFVNYDK